eukprot:4933589-Amphidinium_carterae.1
MEPTLNSGASFLEKRCPNHMSGGAAFPVPLCWRCRRCEQCQRVNQSEERVFGEDSCRCTAPRSR